MFDVTEMAQQQIADFFKDKEVKAIRLFLNQSGWGGPSLALVLDEPNDSDEVYDFNGFKFIANKELLEQTQPVKVDFQGVGFQITSNLDMGAGGCSGCGTTSNCC